MITEIKLKNEHKKIKTDFEWRNIPQFIVLTGLNGSGKSQILEVLNNPEHFLNEPKFQNNQVQYIPVNHDFSKFFTRVGQDALQNFKDEELNNLLASYDYNLRYHNGYINKYNNGKPFSAKTYQFSKSTVALLKEKKLTPNNNESISYMNYERKDLEYAGKEILITEKLANILENRLTELILDYDFCKNKAKSKCNDTEITERGEKNKYINDILIKKFGFSESLYCPPLRDGSNKENHIELKWISLVAGSHQGS